MKRGMLVFGAYLFLIVGFSSQVNAAKTEFLLDWIIYGKHAPFFVAQDMGFYKNVGLDVEYRRGFGSGDTVKKVGAKVAPIGFAATDSVINARANSDLLVKTIAMIEPRSLGALMFDKAKGYKTPKDLAGTKVGIQQGSVGQVLFPAFAATNGLDAKAVEVANMDYGSLLPSLLAGRVDTIFLFATELPTVRAKAAENKKEIGTFYFSDWGLDTYGNGIMVRDETAQSEPQFVRNAMKALMEGWAWAMLHVEETVKNFLKYAPGMSEPLIREHLAIAIEHALDDGTRRHGLGYMDHRKMDRGVELLTRLQNLKKRVPTEDLYTNRFLPQWPAIKAALGDEVK